MPDDLIPLKYVCLILPSSRPGKKLHFSTVYRWVAHGKLRAWKIGGHLFCSESEVRAFARLVVPVELPRTEREASAGYLAAVAALKALGVG